MKIECLNGQIFVTKYDDITILHCWSSDYKSKNNIKMSNDELKENIKKFETIDNDELMYVYIYDLKLNRIQLIMLIHELRKYIKEQ